MWASAPTEVCCGRHRLAKMLRRGGACPRPRAAIKAAPTSGVLSPAGYLAVLGRRGGCPHPPGAGRWPGGAGRRGRRPLQKVCCGRHRPAKMLRRGGACPRLRAAIKAAPTFPGFRLWRAILRCSKHVGAGAHTRPQAVRQDKAPASGGTPCAGVFLSPEEVIRMANYTQYYHLHQWEPEDSFLRTDFNGDLFGH